MAIRSQFPEVVEAVMHPLGRGIARVGVSANMLTTSGLLFTAAATWAIANGHPMAAALLLAAGGLMDLLDGAVARATNRSTPFGGFYDSVTDRVSDGMILGGIAWWLSDEPRLFALTIVALVAAEVTSYVRARAEAIDLTCTIGIFERAERAVLLIIGLAFHAWLLEPVLWILAVGSTFTVVQRIHHVWCQIDRDIPDELLAVAMADYPWSKAFKGAARRFYGERNFAGAVDGLEWTSGSSASSDNDPPPAGSGKAAGKPRDADATAPAERDAGDARDGEGGASSRPPDEDPARADHDGSGGGSATSRSRGSGPARRRGRRP